MSVIAIRYVYLVALAVWLGGMVALGMIVAPALFQTLPYVLTLIAVAGLIGRSIPPAAIGRPYEKQ